MGPFPASGNRVDLKFIGILRIENGKVAEIWVEWDNLTVLTQLGHFPPGKAAADA
jgi:predicted ester cyclase